jgi:hypothetical protein
MALLGTSSSPIARSPRSSPGMTHSPCLGRCGAYWLATERASAATLDVVYANAVLMCVREQVRALAEMRHVLCPAGLAAVIDDDLGTVVISPDRPELRLAPRLFECAVAHEGGNARYSRRLRTLMLEAGFARTQGVAHAPEVYADLASTRWFAEFAAGLFSAPSMAEVIVEERWATRVELDGVITALRERGELPDAFASWLYCGALGWLSRE